MNDFDPEDNYESTITGSSEQVPEEQIIRGTDQPTENSTKTKTSASKRTAPRKPRAEKAEKADKPASSPFAWVTDKRTAIFIGIVLMLATLYLLVVALSYFKNVTHDQYVVLNTDIGDLAAFTELTKNLGGPLGAWLAEHLVSQWLGLGTFVLVFWMGWCSLALLGVAKIRFWSATFRCLLLAVAVSIVVGFVTYNANMPFYWGGFHGWLFNHEAMALAGYPGAIAASIVVTAIVCLVFGHDLVKFGQWCARLYGERKLRLQEMRAEREEKRQQQSQQKEERKAAAKKPKETVEEAESQPDESEQDGGIAPAAIPTMGTFKISNPEDEDDVAMVIETPEIEQAEGEISTDPEADVQSDMYDPRADLSRYQFPTLDLLKDYGDTQGNVNKEEQEENKERITKTLNDFGIPISSIKATIGPTVTLYEIVPAEGIRIAKVKRLEDDIALSLAALGIRIIAPIPGKGTIGIEVPNKDPQTVAMRSVLGSKVFAECQMALPMALGCTISNEVFIADLAKMPHLLVAGATGMGKSVGLNAIIASLLYKKHPAELKFVLVDPKQVEFSLYSKLERHYLAKLPDEEDAIVTKPEKVLATLNSLCVEMDNRYELLKYAGCRTLKEYNEKFVRRVLNPEKGHRFLQYIVVIVDEFADLIMTAGKEVEKPIARIAQKARAVGIHMILATQRPSTNVITGVIKANFPGRIAFRVFQMVDSRTILDRPGANQLIGRGDMLFSNNGNIERVQCAFIDTPEVDAICDFIDGQIGYDSAYLLPEFVPESDGDSAAGHNIADRDPLFDESARFVVQSNTASTSSLQRRYSIGYNRAGKIMDQMEAAGIVGPAMGGKPRQVLMDSLSLERLLETYNS
ncbi:MAG: DNA translocase FtsK [Muribaculaceae bacterium]|nr:DNA translocase FtsK [Muribaculaceae bacterium]